MRLKPSTIAGSMFVAVAAVGAAASGIFVDRQDPSALPFQYREKVELASDWAGTKRSSLWVDCTSRQELRLVLRSRLPISREFIGYDLSKTVYTLAVIFVHQGQDTLRGFSEAALDNFGVKLVQTGWVDTVVSSPLSEPQLGRLASSFGRNAPKRVSFGLLESMVFMRGRIAGAQFQAFADHCRRSA